MVDVEKIKELVERFERNLDAYRSGKYKEEQLRLEFINPFFLALGWDVYNQQGHAEAYKDVVHEDSLPTGGGTKAPDYCFRIGGTRKFFVEAKKPSVDIKENIHPAYQLRRYAWSAKLPLSILTDFEEFAVYDCRIKPAKTDKASAARILYIEYSDYLKRWDEIASIFSKEAVLKGSFDKYVESTKLKRGTAEVDDAFLAEIEQWRDELARNIALRNPKLSTRQLNFAVQKTIDRIIFLRICEDRGIEGYGQLQALLNGANIYKRLTQLFRDADDRYNSGLFHFKKEKSREEPPDDLTLNLTIDNDKLKRIIKDIYYPDSPYEFSVLPADILGHVYEQFLGKVIRLTKAHYAKVEEKPEVRKAGGVYYTPTYIVDYIVSNTVGKLCKDKTPKGVAKLRILDPACGSGSFLLGAYQYLLDWHRDYYIEDGPEKHRKQLYQVTEREWRLSTEERKRILTNNIYGVDIDLQAVEVTKLSLLLKVLEGESEETLKRQLAMFHQRALPDLGSNIKCGNSLIGSDFYANRQTGMFDDEAQYRINAFDWEVEFKEIFPSPQSSPKGRGSLPSPSGRRVGDEGGGFHAVIGNPPYRRELDYKSLMDEIASTSFGEKYRSPRMDLWYYFVHRGLELLKPKGILSFITNAYWTAGTGSEKLITALRENVHIDEIFSLGDLKVFKNVTGQHMIMRISNAKSTKTTMIKLVESVTEETAKPFVTGNTPVNVYKKNAKQLFRNGKIDLQPPSDDLLEKIESFTLLEQLGLVRQGIAENPQSINQKTNIKYGNKWNVGEGVFALRINELENLNLPEDEKNLIRPYHDLCDLHRYYIASTPSLYLIYSTKRTCPDINKYPKIKAHLIRFKVIMDARRETRNGSNSWWHLHWPRDEALWKARKIISIQMAERPSFVPSKIPTYVPFSTNVFVPFDSVEESLQYVAGLLNSRLLWAWYQHYAKRRGVGLEINGNVLRRSPIRTIDFDDPQDKAMHDRMVELVERMLDLNKKLAQAKVPDTKKRLQRRIAATDTEIDKLVYELYDLTEEEIRIVESPI